MHVYYISIENDHNKQLLVNYCTRQREEYTNYFIEKCDERFFPVYH